MIQAAHFDIKTVTGLRQALVLSAEYENEPFPLEGYTLHGSIGTYPRMDLKCSVDENGRARIEWDSVPPGNWKYDVFLISASNDETPLMEGTFTALPRITPVLDDESVNDEVGGVLRLPSGNEGTITLEVDGGFVSKEYAAIAKDAADKAQQALEAIPEVDASGNMTLSGTITATAATINGPLVVNNPDGSGSDGTLNQIYGITRFYQSVDLRSGGWLRGTFMVETGILNISQGASFNCAGAATFSSAINANGGVNIPLAVGAPTATGGVNRLYAAGLAGVTGLFTLPAYLDTGAVTATGTAATTVLIPGQYAQTNVRAGTHSTIVHYFAGPKGQWNYTSFAGFAIPWQLTSAGKLTVGIGRGSKTVRKDLTQESYSIIPGNELAYNTGEILDITFDNARDLARGGYVIRVREIYAAETARIWKVKTTTSFIPATQNEPIPYIVNKVIYHQYAPRSYNAGDYGDAYGSLYLLTGGGSSQQLWKIAAVRGVTTFETGTGFSSIVTDIPGISGGSVNVFVGAAERTNYQPGNENPVYYALEALAVNAIESEETADFEDINIPIE